MSSGLSEEARRRIEENKRKAIAKRAERQAQQTSSSFNASTATKANCTSSSLRHETQAKISSSRETGSPATGVGCSKGNVQVTSGNNATTDPWCLLPRKPSQFPPGSNAGVSLKNDLRNKRSEYDGPATASKVSSSHGSTSATDTQCVQDRIEANRQKALAKRAEKQRQSPLKASAAPSIVPLANQNVTNFPGASSASGSLSRPQCVQGPGTSVSRQVTGNKSLPSETSSLQPGLKPAATQGGHGSRNDMPQIRTSVGQKPAPNVHITQMGQREATPANRNAFCGVKVSSVKGSCLLVSRTRFEVTVGYSAPLLEIFKMMNTKQYDAVTKKWSFKLEEYNRLMTAVGPLKPSVEIEGLPKAILQAFSSQLKGDNRDRDIPEADLSRVEPGLVNSLMSFQRQGVNFGIYRNGRVLIADDMGLGKTIQAICLACYYREEWPLLIVVPSSVRFDWAQQFKRWAPSVPGDEIRVAVTGKDSCRSGLINILSYDLMVRKASELKDRNFQVIIMDECHLLKNYKTARCKAAMPLLKTARRVMLLSGTPALSRPMELYTQICAVCPFLFKFQDFGVRYCDGKQMQWGWDYSGSSNMAELQILLEEKVMIRRLKKEVLSELPDKVRQMVLLDPSSIKVNKDLKQASKVLNTGNLKGMAERGALLEYFHESGRAKVAAVREYVKDMLEGDRKFIVFAHHQEVLDSVEDIVKSVEGPGKYIRIDGRTGSELRSDMCQRFQHSDSIRAAILSITAANAGINLSAANLVIFAELFWNPGILVQAEDRAHRLGQKDSVSVHYLVAQSTSDDHIWPMIQRKLEVLGKAGLTKDDFSSANTTTVKDKRQLEIINFLEESFTEDFVPEGDSLEVEFNMNNKKSKTDKRQASITKFLSPTKDEGVATVYSSPPKEKKPRGLFKYFSPTKSEQAVTGTIVAGRSDSGHDRPTHQGHGQGQGCFSAESRQKSGHEGEISSKDVSTRDQITDSSLENDNELEMFLDDGFDEDWPFGEDSHIDEPQKKKQRKLYAL